MEKSDKNTSTSLTKDASLVKIDKKNTYAGKKFGEAVNKMQAMLHLSDEELDDAEKIRQKQRQAMFRARAYRHCETKIIRPEHKAVIDVYFENGFAKYEAYKAIYPNVTTKSAQQAVIRVFKRPEVQEYIEEKFKQLKLQNETSVESIRAKLAKIYNICMDKGRLSDAIKCVELEGKTIGAFTDVQENRNIDFADWLKEMKAEQRKFPK